MVQSDVRSGGRREASETAAAPGGVPPLRGGAEIRNQKEKKKMEEMDDREKEGESERCKG